MKIMLKLLTVVGLLLITSLTAAATRNITYMVSMNELPLGLATLRISINPDTHYQLDLAMENIMPGIPLGGKVQSKGLLKQGYPQPENYLEQVTFNDLEHNKTLRFDWKNNQVINPKKNREKDIQPKTLDALSLLLALPYNIQKALPLHYLITDGKTSHPVNFTSIGSEMVKTPIKSYETMIIQNPKNGLQPQLTLWLAKQNDFIPVQAKLVLEDGIVLTALLTS